MLFFLIWLEYINIIIKTFFQASLQWENNVSAKIW